MGFFGTNMSDIIKIIGNRTYDQRLKIKEAFKKAHGDDLFKKLESKTSFNLKKLVTVLFSTPVENDAQALRRAIKGLGTDEGCLIEILCNRSNKELKDIKTAYSNSLLLFLLRFIHFIFNFFFSFIFSFIHCFLFLFLYFQLSMTLKKKKNDPSFSTRPRC